MEDKPITAIIVLFFSKHLVKELIINITRKIECLNEIILIDNSNQDLSEFENSLVKVVYPHKNIGYGPAINIGLQIAQNETILILNPDIKINKWSLPGDLFRFDHFLLSAKPEEWPCMKKFPHIVYDFFRYALGNLAKPFSVVNHFYGRIPVNQKTKLQKVDWISGSLILTNKSTMETLNGFDENYFLFYEEVDLCKRASINNIFCFITPMITYLNNQGTASSKNVNEIKFISGIKSTQIYHTRYSGKKLSYYLFYILKLHCRVVSILLKVRNSFLPTQKTIEKEQQYSNYYKNIL